MSEKLTELINNAIKAIRADEGRQMKMTSFCSHNEELCHTSFCLAGWLVLAQPEFSKEYILKDLSVSYEDPEDQTWEEAIGDGNLSCYLEHTGDRLLSKEFKDDPHFSSFDLFYLHLTDDETAQLADLCQKIGVDPSNDALTAFDSLPQKVRMEAAIKVLELFRDEKKVKWLPAIRYAIEKYVCEKSAW